MTKNGSEICAHKKSVHEHKEPVITIRTKKTFRDKVQYLKVFLISLGIALAYALTVYKIRQSTTSIGVTTPHGCG